MFLHAILVAAGGALGALGRWGGELWLAPAGGHWGYTAAVNGIGSLIIGVAWVLLAHFDASQGWYRFCLTGVLGGFTTFSAFSLDVVRLAGGGRPLEAASCALLSVAVSLAGCAAGVWAARYMLR